MPELPEVENVCRKLCPIIGRKITHVGVYTSKLRIEIPENLAIKLTHRTIKTIERKGKYILIHLDNQDVLLIHLGMTGVIKLFGSVVEGQILDRHDHLSIYFTDGSTFIFNDVRRFGLVMLKSNNNTGYLKLLNKVGVEPLSDHWDVDGVFAVFQQKKSPIKTTLMDNSLITGIGNIYANEILYRSKIHPETVTKKLHRDQFDQLVIVIRQVLQEAINAGGSSIKNFQHTDGNSGKFSQQFRVYGRKDQPCFTCDDPIMNKKIAGRSTYYCQRCQILI